MTDCGGETEAVADGARVLEPVVVSIANENAAEAVDENAVGEVALVLALGRARASAQLEQHAQEQAGAPVGQTGTTTRTRRF
mmetsp:Transcript_2353/g.5520  ORF Transcript_2353/g.5520 Transcript_2353/m.5520 type:complete len:82 (-) Transcript_2353:2257-2502(-)